MMVPLSLVCALLLGLRAGAPLAEAGEPANVRLLRRSSVHDRVELEFVLKLPREQKLYFIGAGPTSPAYELQLLEDGQWKDYQGTGWCGNALDVRETSPKRSRFKIHIDPAFAGDKSFRVGVRIFRKKPGWNTDGSADLPESSTIWSDPVEP